MSSTYDKQIGVKEAFWKLNGVTLSSQYIFRTVKISCSILERIIRRIALETFSSVC